MLSGLPLLLAGRPQQCLPASPFLFLPQVWLAILSFYLIAGITAMLVLVRAYPNLFMFIRSTTLSTERIKYRVTFSAVTMVIALTLLVLLILQNML